MKAACPFENWGKKHEMVCDHNLSVLQFPHLQIGE